MKQPDLRFFAFRRKLFTVVAPHSGMDEGNDGVPISPLMQRTDEGTFAVYLWRNEKRASEVAERLGNGYKSLPVRKRDMKRVISAHNAAGLKCIVLLDASPFAGTR